MNERQARAWRALDIGPLWLARHGAPERPEAPVEEANGAAGLDATIDRLGFDELAERVAGCTACRLCESRSRTVFGVGDRHARWMVVGEAPGAEEDRQGLPFVGKAGRLLDSMLAGVGLSRADGVFIANVLKCRPPGNRDPLPEEIAQCAPFLRRQIELVDPRLILVVGRFAAQTLLQSQQSIGALRGRVHSYQLGARRVPVVVTYHPAYLLRDRHQDKAKVWRDLCLARANTADGEPRA